MTARHYAEKPCKKCTTPFAPTGPRALYCETCRERPPASIAGAALTSPVPQSVLDRFWANVDRSGECWCWTGARSGIVPVFTIDGAPCDARRVAWEFAGRGSLEGLTLRPWRPSPRCEALCVRPDHHVAFASRQPERSLGVLNLMADRAAKREQPHTIATQPGGPLGARHELPDDLREPLATEPVGIDRVMQRAAGRIESDALCARDPWRLVIEEAGISVRLYEREPGSLLYREFRLGGRKDRKSLGHRDRALAEAQARDEARAIAAELRTGPSPSPAKRTAGAVVGPFGSGGFVAITPWGSFNGATMLAACASADAERPPTQRF